MHVHLRLEIAPLLAWSCVQVGVAVEGATHAATAAASLVLTQPGLSSLVPPSYLRAASADASWCTSPIAFASPSTWSHSSPS